MLRCEREISDFLEDLHEIMEKLCSIVYELIQFLAGVGLELISLAGHWVRNGLGNHYNERLARELARDTS